MFNLDKKGLPEVPVPVRYVDGVASCRIKKSSSDDFFLKREDN